ncbi:MAG: sigma-54-dependent Fis family transcriptional regulator [Bdellovibrionales bacterium]|nr:sigma-54-dependent Fis family transcriptional regulator [Bdellovibrionales bacterium]
MKTLEPVNAKARVLVVDDEKNIVTVLKAILEKREFEVDGFSSARDALDSLRKNHYDAAVTDLYMPEVDGMAFLAESRRLYPSLPVVMITAFGTVDSAVDAIKKGAFDYVTKPFEQSEIVQVVQKAVNTSRLSRLDVEPAQEAIENVVPPILRGESPAARALRDSIARVAPTPSVVLLLGETGTGKEVVAEEIHRKSDRAWQDLVRVNCAAVAGISVEQEIFGGTKPGRIELAHKGTLFLDEISELPADAQGRLLEFLETGQVRHPLTGDGNRFDVRVVVGTRKDLQKAVKDGAFREDLWYRLNVVPIGLAPLRERKEDMPAIVDGVIHRLNTRLNKAVTGVDAACMELLRSLPWPGNFRQLENTLERMVVMAGETLLVPRHVPDDARQEHPEDLSNFREIVRRQTHSLERELIERALEELDGNVTRTAEYLGISRKGLQLKMKELGIKRDGETI